jgi:hypothetical protein
MEGISMGYLDVIEFSGSTMPTNNLPGIGGFYTPDVATNSTPRMVFNSGGTFDLAIVGYEDEVFTNTNGTDRVVITVGDGIGGGTEDVTVNWTGGDELSRHGDCIHQYVINEDGTLNRLGGFDFSRNATRIGKMTIDGGTVVVSGTTYELKAQAAAVINFAALGSSYQSAWGGEFNSISDVEASFGVDFLNTSGVAGSELVASSIGSGWKVELLSSTEVADLYKTYTWTGAVDGNWSNAANWDANGIPVDDTADTEAKYVGLTLPSTYSIVLDGSTMPTSNVPEIGNWYDNSYPYAGNSPMMVFNSGGEFNLDGTKGEFGAFLTNPNNDARTILTVGDGIGGGADDVTVNVLLGGGSDGLQWRGVLNRHNNGSHNYLVKSDGTLNLECTTTNFLSASYSPTTRPVTFTIEGGTVVINDAVRDLTGTCYVSFSAPGGTFTAKYGEQFPSITEVWDSLGTVFLDDTGNPFGTLQAVDVGGTNFTVSVAATAIQWGLAQTITGDADVSTEGALEYAYNAGTSSDATIEGVTFTGSDSTTAFGSDISLTSFTGVTADFGSFSENPYASLTADYRSLLSTAATNGAAVSAVTLNNLTIGKRYQVQVWINDSSSSNTNAQPVYLSIGTAGAVELDPANPDAEGALGQYGIGTFVADAVSQTFALGGNRLQLNAIQVRQVNDINVGYWTGTGGVIWDASTTTNFAVNKLDEALSVTTFDVAKAVNGTVTFADAYFDSGATVAVTNSNITIDGAVEADTVYFINDTVDYTLNGGAIEGSSSVEVSGGGTLAINSAQTFSNGLAITDGSVVKIDNGSQLGASGSTVTLNGGEISADGGTHVNMLGAPANMVLGANGGTLRNASGYAFYGLENLVISGAGQMTYAGSGNWGGNNRIQPNGTHTYTGGTLLTDKVNLLAYSDASFGAPGTKITIDDGRYMAWNDVNLGSREIEIASGGAQMALDNETTTIEGLITGTGALEINGQNRNGNSGAPGGLLIITNANNTLTGAVLVDNVTVQMNGDNALGTGSLTLDTSNTNGATARLKNNGNGTAPVLDNAVTIGAGGAELMAGWNQSLTLNGDLSGSGNLTIVADSGIVYLNNGGGSYTGTNTVASGAKLGGFGSVGGALIMETNSTLIVDLATGGMSVSGDLTLSSDVTLTLSGTVSGAGATIVAAGGTVSGEFAGYPEGTEVQTGFTISYLSGGVKIIPDGPYQSPTIDESISGGVVTLSWPSSIVAGDQFNVMTNIDLVYGTWAVDTSMVPYLDGDTYKATNSVGAAPQVFYKLEY